MISIIIATKNGGKWLPRSLASIEAQSEKDFEVIVVSDGSTDNTPEIIRQHAATRPWLRLIELKENVGPGLARDRGIKEAKGMYIALLDDDDEWVSVNKLKIQKEYLASHPEYVAVGSEKVDIMRDDGTLRFVYTYPIRDEILRDNLLLRNCFTTSAVMFKKEAYEKAGGFSKMYLAEDYDLWLRLAQVGKISNLADCVTRYYVRDGSAARENRLKMSTTILALVKKYHKKYPHYYKALFKTYLRILERLFRG
jgi:glycosyltransferase involved in cell wall biosynthesis